MRTYYLPIEPYATHYLPVDNPHVIYVEECGNPKGIPVLFIHGGPGAGCNPDNRRFFNPQHYRIILFDQRGCGKSSPHAELLNNTTQSLISDIEVIRQKLQISKWLIFGGSWGSTLSLIYAITYPSHVLGLILRGIYLCRQQDFDWLYQNGASQVFPEYWSDFIASIPVEKRNNFIKAYYEYLISDNEEIRIQAAINWSLWEGRCSQLFLNEKVWQRFMEPQFALSFARIECHYFINHIFLEENFIINNAKNLQGIPGVMVHGRYDMCCPLDNAWTLHQAWPEAELYIIPDAGHAATEPGILDKLITATDNFAQQLIR